MNAKYVVYVALIVVVFTAGALFGDVFKVPAMAQDEAKNNAPVVTSDDTKDTKEPKADPAAPAADTKQAGDAKPDVPPALDITAILKPAPVVAAFPYRSETEYRMDPFNEEVIRSTETKVTKICIVRADGKMEIVEPK